MHEAESDRLKRYALAVAAVAITAAIRLSLGPILGNRLPFAALFLSLVIVARYGGVGPSLLALVAGTAFGIAIGPRRAVPGPVSAINLGFFVLICGALIAFSAAHRRIIRRYAQEADERGRAEWSALVAEARLRLALAAGRMEPWDWDLTGDGPPALDGGGAIHPEDRDRVRDAVAEATAGANELSIEYRLAGPDGVDRWVEARGRVVREVVGAPTRMVGVCIDIHERKQNEARLAEQGRIAETLHRIGLLVAAELDLQRIVQVVTDEATRLTDAQIGAFFFNKADERGDSYTLFTISGAPRAAFETFPMPRVTPLFEETFRGRGVVRLDDVTTDARYGQNSPHHGVPDGHLPVRSYLAVPVVSRNGEVLGGLFLGHERTGVFSAAGERIAVGIAAQAAVAIENARLLAEAQESEGRFRQLAEHIDDIFWLADPNARTVLYVSPAYEAITGRPARELIERPELLIESVHPEDQGRFRAVVAAQARGEVTAGEFRIVRPDGSVRWIWDRGYPIRDVAGRIVRVAGLAEDITERKRVEQALRESEDRFRQLADALPQIVWTAGPDGRLDSFNRRWYTFTGFPPEQGTEGWRSILHPADAGDFLGRLAESVATGSPFEAEFRAWDRAAGQYRWHLGRALSVTDPEGALIRWVGSWTDIDDRRRAEDALREADRRRGEFLATLGHELRNPLAPIRNALYLLRHGEPIDSHADLLALMDRQVRQLTRLVEDLLDIARIDSGKIELRPRPTDLIEVVRAAEQTCRSLIESRSHRLEFDLPPGPIWLDADPERLEQVMGNLLTNAAKYTDPGGTIWLEAAREGESAVVRVRDNGVGIDPGLLPRIFNLYVQDERGRDRSQGGLGIGLSLVSRLVEMHSGTIEAHSDGPGRGSEFVVRLPITVRADAPRVGPRSSNGPLPRRRVLVVDDNEDAAASLGRLLTRAYGQDVALAHDGPSALSQAEATRPEVILLDLGLPGLDGYEVASRLRARPEFDSVLLVALTGWGQEEDRLRALASGFDHHLVKPVDPDALRPFLSDPSRPEPEAESNGAVGTAR